MVDGTSIIENFKNWLYKRPGESDFGMGDLALPGRDGLESSLFSVSLSAERRFVCNRSSNGKPGCDGPSDPY